MAFESRYGQVASAFRVFRPDYPAEIFERMLAVVPLDRRNCAMDLGAGTGKATAALTRSFRSVIAVEADPLMAEKIPIAAPGAIVRITTAEDCIQQAASVDLINIATALRWMDAPRVLSKAVDWLRPGGILVAYGYFPPGTPEPLRSLVEAEFQQRWNPYLDPRIRNTTREQQIIHATSGLQILEDRQIPHVVRYTMHEFVGFCRSTSYGSAYARTIPDPEKYWRDLESRFLAACGEDKIPVDFSPWFILARRVTNSQ